jgi:hypothetical protein
MMIDGAYLRQRVAEQLQSQREAEPSAYGDGMVRGMEIVLEEIDTAIRRACCRPGSTL